MGPHVSRGMFWGAESATIPESFHGYMMVGPGAPSPGQIVVPHAQGIMANWRSSSLHHDVCRMPADVTGAHEAGTIGTSAVGGCITP